ncbi:uncharacterized protein DNG_01416 [Cephalotrichum gorgonifer]|uniref:CENP-V/GFA domain-containing protein n=1 Tax=Cephalotrichum gorgonifer TaxID=2041049 RepID=A0AAE8SRT3_9PEZI|nr:uncharacterized protein DNG_01416 [Cephalotrichum gorgonifer]
MATPLAAFLRVPLEWFHTRLLPRHDEETEHMIRRRYIHSSDAQKIFCGFCGTPVTYWSPEGHREADYINVTLGSLYDEDVDDLEAMGLVPTADDDEDDTSSTPSEKKATITGQGTATRGPEAATAAGSKGPASTTAADDALGLFIREFSEIPWFDALVDGSALGRLTKKRKVAAAQSAPKVVLNWDVVEWPDSDSPEPGKIEHGVLLGKRKFETMENA